MVECFLLSTSKMDLHEEFEPNFWPVKCFSLSVFSIQSGQPSLFWEKGAFCEPFWLQHACTMGKSEVVIFVISAISPLDQAVRQ